MEEATSSLKPSQKAKLHEVADGLLNVYRTLVRMQYLEPSWIHEGPHDMTAVLPACEEAGLDPSIIYLYSILPYVDASYARGLDFFQGGRFLDFRSKSSIEYGRDPMYSSEENEMMRPWMTPLSGLGNHRTVIIYDAREHVIGMFDQESTGSTDHNLSARNKPVDEGMDDWASDDGSNGDDEEGEERGEGKGEGDDDGDEWEDEDEDEDMEDDDGDDTEDEDDEANGDNIWDEMDSRKAPEVLRDMVLWYENLTEFPGDGDNSGGEWKPEVTKPLYLKHGWPRPDFDADAFVVDQARGAAAAAAKWRADEPLRKVRELTHSASAEDTHRIQEQHKAIAKAKNPDDEWLARWELWHGGLYHRNAVRELVEAKATAERLCPGGVSQKPDELPLWELRQLRADFRYEKGQLNRLRKEVEVAGGPDAASKPLLVRLAWAEKWTAILQRAVEACEAEAGGRSFPVGRGVEEQGVDLDEMLECHDRTLKGLEVELEEARGWLAGVPEGGLQARDLAQKLIEEYEGAIERVRADREKYLAVDGEAAAGSA